VCVRACPPLAVRPARLRRCSCPAAAAAALSSRANNGRPPRLDLWRLAAAAAHHRPPIAPSSSTRVADPPPASYSLELRGEHLPPLGEARRRCLRRRRAVDAVGVVCVSLALGRRGCAMAPISFRPPLAIVVVIQDEVGLVAIDCCRAHLTAAARSAWRDSGQAPESAPRRSPSSISARIAQTNAAYALPLDGGWGGRRRTNSSARPRFFGASPHGGRLAPVWPRRGRRCGQAAAPS
jgi:hypothetical protein